MLKATGSESAQVCRKAAQDVIATIELGVRTCREVREAPNFVRDVFENKVCRPRQKYLDSKLHSDADFPTNEVIPRIKVNGGHKPRDHGVRRSRWRDESRERGKDRG